MREIRLGVPQGSGEHSARDHDLASLIGKVADGDQSALSALLDATSRLVFGLALRILGDRSTAEEVMLDVFTQVWRQADSYDRKRGAPLAWILTIARSRAIDRLRSSKNDQLNSEPVETLSDLRASVPSPEENTALSERKKLVRIALSTLAAEQREVIELAYYSGLSHSEIALKLGQPLGTVKTRVRLGMIKLRESLMPLLEGKQ
jgi:RNA polymerase sigma-70 factor (ECF subfamily)